MQGKLGSTPRLFTLRSHQVNGLRDIAPIPDTYRRYQTLPDGQIIYIGEFPTPQVKYIRAKK